MAGRNEAEHCVQVTRFLHDHRLQSSLPADRYEQVIVSWRVSPREQEESLTTKGLKRKRPASCEAMTFRKRDDQWFAHEGLYRQGAVAGGEP